MGFLVWLLVVNLLLAAALVLLLLPRVRFATPWLGLATVTVGTFPAFSSSATLAVEGTIGVGLGWLVTAVYGLIALIVVIGYVRLRPVPYVPLGAVLAGVAYIASFYAYFPPYSSIAPGLPGMLVFATPGLVFVVYGAILWYRHGLAPVARPQGAGLRLGLAIGIVAVFGTIGIFGYQSDRNDPPSWATRPLNMPRMATDSPLVAEGTVAQKESRTVELQRPSGRTRVYTLYKIEVSQLWRGEDAGTLSVAVPDFSSVTPTLGQAYLLFFSGRADQDKFPGHWSLVDPQQVWVVNGSGFNTYPGITPVTSLTKRQLTELLAANPNN